MTMGVVALAGGVGAARLLRGLVEVVEPSAVTAVVNTGDDFVLNGLHVSPDIDTVTYTLAGAVNPATGWGLAGETWSAMEALARYGPSGVAGQKKQPAAARGRRPRSAEANTGPSLGWFRLGDRDLATHLYRTGRLRDGAVLSEVTAEVAAAWGVGVRLLPMTDGVVATMVSVLGEGEIGFQEYFVGRRHDVAVTQVRFAGAEEAAAGPGVLDALAEAEWVLICPSNPILSVAPILAVPDVREAVVSRRESTVAVSPIVDGAAVKGPAARVMSELGHEPSVVGVARLYAPLAAVLVVDVADADLAGEVEAEGMRCVVAPSLMHGVAEAAALARTCLAAAVAGS